MQALVPFPPGPLSANLADIPTWSTLFPLSPPRGEGKNVETAWATVMPGWALNAIQQGPIGTCGPQSASHALRMALVNQIAAGDRRTPLGQASVEWLYGMARTGMPDSKPMTPRQKVSSGSAFYDVIRCVRHYGAILSAKYPQLNLGSYQPEIAMKWGADGVPPWTLTVPRYLPRLVLKITSPAEWVSAINHGFCMSASGHWVFYNTDPNGIVTGPNVSPLSVPAGSSPFAMWSHAMAGIGYRVLGGKLYAGYRNLAAPSLHRGGQDKLFPYRGTGLISFDDPIIQTVFAKFPVIAFGDIQMVKPG